MRTHNQQKRHIINVPVPFTEEQLFLLIKHFNGFDDEVAKRYLDHILKEKRVNLNPSSSLGEGANIVDIFNFGFMARMKEWFNIDVDPSLLWWHPMKIQTPKRIADVAVDYEEVEIESNEDVITEALDGSGNTVRAEDICPGNSDNLDAYDRPELFQ